MNTVKIIFILLFLSGSQLNATNYYVSNTGDNGNDGLTLDNAFQTLQYAADGVITGDTVFVTNGIYAGFDLRDRNGTALKPIVFMAMGTEVIIAQSGPIRADGINIENADYVIIDGFMINDMPGNGNGIRVVLSNHCVVRNCRCDHNAERGIFTAFTDDILIEHNICTNSVDEHGIYVSNSSDRPIIRYNECYGNNNIGIHLNGDLSEGGDGIISDAMIYGNALHDNNLAAGINLDGVENPIIYNNIIYNNHAAQGIALFQGDGAIVSSGAKIYNNTILIPDDGRWGILLNEGANINTEIYNNIIINQHSWRGCIAAESTDALLCDYNILNDKLSDNGDGSTISLEAWQALGLDEHSQLANDLVDIFYNIENGDYYFHLIAASQAVDTGTDLVSATVTVDFEGFPRPWPWDGAYDIGADEYGIGLATVDPFVNDFKVFPNPTTNFFALDAKDFTIKEVILLDLNGQLLKTFSNKKQLNVSDINSGIYILRIKGKQGKVLYRKVVVNN